MDDIADRERFIRANTKFKQPPLVPEVSLLLADERQIARNLVGQLIIFATGAHVGFGDRPKVEAILDRAKTKNYGVRSLVRAIIESDIFRNK